MLIHEIVEMIRSNPSSSILPANGLPTNLSGNVSLPKDVAEFYSLCGGATLYADADYAYRILPPDQVVLMDRDLFGECDCDGTVISDTWYLIAEDLNGSYIAVDLSRQRSGRCYDCFIGEPYPVIATSFREFMERLIANMGEYPYWMKPGFQASDPCETA